jgi:phosphoribosylanthranilate isomerase
VTHVRDAASVDDALAVAARGDVDALLLDSGDPGAAVPELGGTGRVHDWALSAAIARDARIPVLLAGGLGDHNVGAAIATVRPAGIDVCSGVRSGGRLDGGKLAAFVAAVRAARAEAA